MKKIFIMFIICLFIIVSCDKNDTLKNADIIFQSSNSGQARAIAEATGSTYTHMGLIYNTEEGRFVLEAVQPVSVTRFEDWVQRGDNSHYVVKRLKKYKKYYISENFDKLKEYSKGMVGRDYDLYFEWSDEKLYCSELVYKIYANVFQIELCAKKKLKDFDLDGEAVKELMKKRYGENVPYDETVVSPVDIFNSKLLYTVVSEN
ncbi:YiiX family permuted papain-like enzyme [Spirochaetota bacterium]